MIRYSRFTGTRVHAGCAHVHCRPRPPARGATGGEVPQEVRCRCMRRDMAAEQLASAEDVELPEPWGLLVSVETGEEEERLPISSERFTIGRANGVHTHCGVGVGGHKLLRHILSLPQMLILC